MLDIVVRAHEEVRGRVTWVTKISGSLPVLETVSWHLREAVEFYQGIGKGRLQQSLAGARDGQVSLLGAGRRRLLFWSGRR